MANWQSGGGGWGSSGWDSNSWGSNGWGSNGETWQQRPAQQRPAEVPAEVPAVGPAVEPAQAPPQQQQEIVQVRQQAAAPPLQVFMVTEVTLKESHFGANPGVLTIPMCIVNQRTLVYGMSGPQFWVLPCLSLALGPDLPHPRLAAFDGLMVGADPTRDTSFALVGGQELLANKQTLTRCCCTYPWDAQTITMAEQTRKIFDTHITSGPALIFCGVAHFPFPLQRSTGLTSEVIPSKCLKFSCCSWKCASTACSTMVSPWAGAF